MVLTGNRKDPGTGMIYFPSYIPLKIKSKTINRFTGNMEGR
jgi:hypothetical protein